jgi:hypothetical protein
MAVQDKARDGRTVGVAAKVVTSGIIEGSSSACIICASKRHDRIITPGYADKLVPGACEVLAAAVALHTFHFSEAEHTCSTPSHSCTLAEQQFVICKASHRLSSRAAGRRQALPDLPILGLV